MRTLLTFIIALFTLAGCHSNTTPVNQPGPVKVELRNTEHGYQIYLGNSAFFIKGAGGQTQLKMLADSGANTIRTWSTDNARAILDNAHRHGLMVMLGLRLGHERHGFDYSDENAVARQLERVKGTVKQFKDHPALLAWGVGNEVDLFYTNTDVWYAVEDIARFIQQEDPNHLVTTVTAGIDQQKLSLIQSRVPSIDFISINIYGGLASLPATLKSFGYDGPFVVTEWGPTGHWQVEKTPWGAPIEQTSTEKSHAYRQRYQHGINNAQGQALGSFAFLWGQKQETTPTWYGVFTESGQPTEVVDSLIYNWTGRYPEWRSPGIADININGRGRFSHVSLSRSQLARAHVSLILRSDKKPGVHYDILPESTDIKAGGDPETRPPSVQTTIRGLPDGSVEFVAPAKPGPYRLFVYVTDERGRVATANIPFIVKSAP